MQQGHIRIDLCVFELPFHFKCVVRQQTNPLYWLTSPLPDRQHYHSAHDPPPAVPRPAGRHPALPGAPALRPAALQRAAEAPGPPPQLVELRLLKLFCLSLATVTEECCSLDTGCKTPLALVSVCMKVPCLFLSSVLVVFSSREPEEISSHFNTFAFSGFVSGLVICLRHERQIFASWASTHR